MKRMIAILYTMFWVSVLLPQNSIDLFTLSEQLGVPTGYDGDIPGKASEKILNVNAKLPVVLSSCNIWYNDINYSYINITNSIVHDSLSITDQNLQGIIIQTGLIHRINEKQSVYVFFVPRLMHDIKGVGMDGLQLGGIFLFENRCNEDLTLRFGASYNHDLFGPFVVPLVYVNWNASSKVFISGLLPIYCKVGYHISDKFTLGIHQFGIVSSYKLKSGGYIENKRIELNCFGRYKVTQNIHTELRMGYSLKRTYAQFSGNDKIDFGMPLLMLGDNRAQLNQNFNNAILINLRLVYNLPLNN